MKPFLLQKLRTILIFSLLFFAISVCSYGATVTWIGTDDHEWDTSTNWDTGNEPSSDDDVVIGISTKSIYPELKISVTVKSVTVNNGSKLIISAGKLTVTDGLVNNSSGVGGESGVKIKDGGVIEGNVSNSTDATIDIYTNCYINGDITNAGIINDNIGTIQGTLNNSGTITTTGGTFKDILNSGTVNFSSGTVKIDGSYTEAGTCSTQFGTGTVFFNNDVEFVSSSLTSGISTSNVYFSNPELTGDNATSPKTVTIAKDYAFGEFNVCGEVNVQLGDGVTLTCTDFNLNSFDSNYYSTHNFTVNVAGGTVVASAANFNRASATSGVRGTLNIASNFTCTGDIQTHSGTALLLSGNCDIVNLTHSASDSSILSSIRVSGTLNASDYISLCNQSGSTELTIASGGKVITPRLIRDYADYNNGGTGESTYALILEAGSTLGSALNGITTLNLNTALMNNCGTIYTSGSSCSISAGGIDDTSDTGVINFTGGTIEITDDTYESAVNTLNITGTTTVDASFDIDSANLKASTTFTKANTFKNLDVDTSTLGAEGVVKFEAGEVQTINGTLSAAGSENYPLTLTSSSSSNWILDISNGTKPQNSNFSYVQVEYATSLNSSSDAYLLSLVPKSQNISETTSGTGTTVNWFLADYYWFGTTNTSWSTASNWRLKDSDGNFVDCESSPLDDSNTVNIYIGYEDYTSVSFNNSLVLENTVKIKSLYVYDGGTIDFAGNDLESESITNLGKVRLTGSETITNSSGGQATINNGTSSAYGTVEYYGEPTTSASWGTEYGNLLISGATTISSELNVEGTTTIDTGDSTSAVTLSSSDNDFTGNITVIKCGSLTLGASTINGGVEVTQSGDINIDSDSISDGVEVGQCGNLTIGAGTITGTVKVTDSCGVLSINSVSALTLGVVASCSSASVTATGGISLTDDITSTGNQTYTGNVTTSAEITLTGNSVSFDADTTNTSLTINGNLTVDVDSSANFYVINSNNKTLTINGQSSATAYFKGDICSSNTNTNKLSALTASIPVVIVGDCATVRSDAQNYSQSVTCNKNVTFRTVNSSSSIIFNEVLNAGSNNLTFGTQGNATTVTFNDNVTCKQFSSNYQIIFANDLTVAASNGVVLYSTLTVASGKVANIEVNDGSGTCTIKGNVSGTDSTATLNITGNVTLGANDSSNTVSDFDTFTVSGTTTSYYSAITGNNIELSGAVTLNNNLTVTGNTVTVFGSTVDGSYELDLSGEGNASFAGNIGETTALTSLTSNVSCTLGADCTQVKTSGNQVFTKTLTINSDTTLTCSGGALSVEQGITSGGNNLSVSAQSAVFGSETAPGYKGFGDEARVTLELSDSSGAVIYGDNNFYSLNIDGNATFNGDNNFSSFILEGNSTFNGSNTFGEFTAEKAGSILVFKTAETQSFNKIKVTGEEGNRITLKSSSVDADDSDDEWYIVYTGDTADLDTNVNISYVSIQNSNNQTLNSGSHVYLTANDSVDNGNNSYWNFPGATYTWLGGTSSFWNTKSNWQNKSIPGSGTNVIINTNDGGNNPVLTDGDEISPVSLSSIVVNSGKILDLAGRSLIAESITNLGKVRLTGSETITNSSIDNGTSSGYGTVEYYGGSTATAIWGTEYGNLLISGATEITTELNVAGTTTIDTRDTTSEVTLSSSGNDFTGKITVTKCGSLTLGASTISGGVEVTRSGDLTIVAGTITGMVDVTQCGNLDINASAITGDIEVVLCEDFELDADTVTGGVKVAQSGDINIDSDSISDGVEVGQSGDLTLNSDTITGDVKVTGSCGVLNLTSDTVNGNVVVSESGNLTIDAGTIDGTVDVTKSGDLTIGAGTITGTVEVTDSCGVLSININAGSALTLGVVASCSSASVTATGGISLTENITSTGNQTYTGQVSCNEITLTGADITFNDAVNLLDTLTVQNSGTLLFKDTLDSGTDGDYSLIQGDGYEGSVSLQQSIGATSRLNLIKLNGTLLTGSEGLVSSISIITAEDQIYNGSITHYVDTIFNGDNLTFNNNISSDASPATTSVTVTNSGVLTLNPSSISDLNSNFVAKNFVQNGEGSVQLKGIISCVNQISFVSDVYVDGKAGFSAGASSNPITFSKNLYINAPSRDCNIINDTYVAQNFALFNGNVILNDGISFATGKDIVLLNGNTSSMYEDNSVNQGAPSGVSGLYRYITTPETLRTSFTAEPSLSSLPAQMPDGTTIDHEGTYSSVLKGQSGEASLNGQVLSVGQNFYNNGVDLKGDALWTLRLKKNDLATDSFAELYNAEISYCTVECSTASATASLSASEGGVDGGNNSGVYFSRPQVKIAYTVYDDVIYVEFKDSISGESIKIENSNNEISRASEKISNSSCSYSTWYDKECTISTDGKSDLSSFYLKSQETWNTDATGQSSGDEQSTDMGRGEGTTDAGGAVKASHKTTIPYIDVPKATSDLFETLRDEHKNRIAHYTSGNKIVSVLDNCPPVLVAVRIGQELHSSDASTQADYDSHNFVEYQYSEQVTLEGVDLDSTNYESMADLGGISNNSAGDTGFSIAGLSSFESGIVNTYVRGVEDNSTVHSLYRKFALTASDAKNQSYEEQTHRIRVGICSYVDDTVIVDGVNYKHWKGYIDGAKAPSGRVTRISNSNIKDVSESTRGVNVLCSSDLDAAHILPQISVGSWDSVSNTELYGTWDTKSPGFAAYISYDGVNTDDASELFGVHEDGITVLNAIEFHIWDNDYDFSSSSTEENFWYTQIGWQNTSRDYTTSNSYAADIFGGSRAFDEDTQRRTSGGVRYSSLYNCSGNFTYATGVKQSHTGKNFADKNITPGATSTKFYPADASASYNSTGSYDGLYFSIAFEANTNHSLKETFTVSYDGQGYITDLAGNVLYANTIYTTDSVDPKFEITVAKLDGEELYVVFNKKIKTENVIVTTDDYVEHKNDTAASLRFVTINDDGTYNVVSDLYVESQKKVVFSNEHFTGIIYKLSDKLNLYQLQNYYLQCYSPFIKDSVDPATGIPGVSVTYIQGYEDGANSTFMPHGEAHCISDFAVNAVEMNYAYDNRVAENTDENFMYDIYTEDSIAVHDWNEEQNNYGSLNAGYDITMQASVYSDDGIGKVEAMFDNSPDADSLSTEYNGNITDETTGESLVSSWRIWLPTELTTLAYEANQDYYKQVVEVQDDLLDFEIPYENVQNWLSGDQVSFLFKLKDSAGQDLTICRHPIFTLDENDSTGGGTYSNPKTEPLYSLRLKDESDLTTLDLWSFKLKSVSRQRGGVSIVNNVINASQGEKTVIQVDVKESSNVSVVVMTLDGDVVQYLQHGTLAAGTHSFTWNGKSKSGKLCARGLYFVRVFGAGIDETRKVMLVKD